MTHVFFYFKKETKQNILHVHVHVHVVRRTAQKAVVVYIEDRGLVSVDLQILC